MDKLSLTQPYSLPRRVVILYCLPNMGYIYVSFLYAILFFKYSTDVLLIAPGVMGFLYGFARIWDAVLDPLIGYLSDKTKSSLGRRRSWLILSAPCLLLAWLMLWNPPSSLQETEKVLWVGLSLLFYSTAITFFAVPYNALGMEMTTSYHERTRLFGYRHVISAIGMLFAFGAFYIISSADEKNYFDLLGSEIIFYITLIFGCMWAALILIFVYLIKERPSHQDRGGKRIFSAYSDVLNNPHARLILFVHVIQNFSLAALTMLAMYVMQYVVKISAANTAFMMVVFAIPALVLTPLWVRLAAMLGKKNLWMVAMIVSGTGYGCFMMVEEGSFYIFILMGALIGMGNACYQILAYSIYADIIDYDEYLSGERKEGAYFAAWNFLDKGAMGIAAMIFGVVLQWAGFKPNVEQNETTILAILILIGAVPAIGHFFCAWLFRNFSLNEVDYVDIREELERRQQVATNS